MPDLTLTLNGTVYELTRLQVVGNSILLTLVPFVGVAIVITLPIIAIEAR